MQPGLDFYFHVITYYFPHKQHLNKPTVVEKLCLFGTIGALKTKNIQLKGWDALFCSNIFSLKAPFLFSNFFAKI